MGCLALRICLGLLSGDHLWDIYLDGCFPCRVPSLTLETCVCGGRLWDVGELAVHAAGECKVASYGRPSR